MPWIKEPDPPRVERIGKIWVVRDDLIPGGTKVRSLPALFDDRKEYVYAGPCQGFAQVALAVCAAKHGKRATVFCAARKERHRQTLAALAAGARVEEVRPGYLSVVQSRARDYCNRTGACLLPFGMHDERILRGLADVASRMPISPAEVWTVAGSGTLSLALQRAWPGAAFHAVIIGAEPPDLGRATAWRAPERFEQDAKEPPPFPSCANYDAKAWRFICRQACDGALFWNVAS